MRNRDAVRGVAAAVRRILTLLGVVLASFVLALPAAAIPPVTRAPSGGAPYPAAGACVDTAGALGPAVCRKITAVLAADEKATTDEIAVAVVPTTGGVPIETWATGLFNAWGVGKAGADNGVLLVIAVQDRRLRLVTGDGIRSRLPDWQASEIVGGTITPFMKEGRTADAVLAGLDAVRRELGHRVDTTNALLAPGTVVPRTVVDPFATSDDEPEESGSGDGALILLVLLAAGIGIIAWVVQLARGETGSSYSGDDSYDRRRRSSYRSFSSSSSRSSSRSSGSSRRSGFGGGRSSGGGASGSW